MEIIMRNFINNLDISEDNKIKINNLGVENGAALLGMIDAVPKEMDSYLGSEIVAKIKQELQSKLTPEEKIMLEAPIPNYKIQF